MTKLFWILALSSCCLSVVLSAREEAPCTAADGPDCEREREWIASRLKVKKFIEIVPEKSAPLTNDQFFIIGHQMPTTTAAPTSFLSGIFKWRQSSAPPIVDNYLTSDVDSSAQHGTDSFYIIPHSDHQFDVRCPQEYKPEEKIYFRDSGNCNRYYKCDDRKVISLSCASDQVFSDSQNECVQTARRQCRKFRPYRITSQYYCRSAHKTQKYFFPDSRNCQVYYKCENANAVQYRCPGALLWNARQDRCDWPENVAC